MIELGFGEVENFCVVRCVDDAATVAADVGFTGMTVVVDDADVAPYG